MGARLVSHISTRRRMTAILWVTPRRRRAAAAVTGRTGVIDCRSLHCQCARECQPGPQHKPPAERGSKTKTKGVPHPSHVTPRSTTPTFKFWEH